MNKKMMMVATTASMIGQFNINNIKLLIDMGYDVVVACNFNSGSSWNQDDSIKLKEQLRGLGVEFHNIPFNRSPLAISDNFRSLLQLNSILKKIDLTLFIAILQSEEQLLDLLRNIIIHHLYILLTGFTFLKGLRLKTG